MFNWQSNCMCKSLFVDPWISNVSSEEWLQYQDSGDCMIFSTPNCEESYSVNNHDNAKKSLNFWMLKVLKKTSELIFFQFCWNKLASLEATLMMMHWRWWSWWRWLWLVFFLLWVLWVWLSRNRIRIMFTYRSSSFWSCDTDYFSDNWEKYSQQ